MAAVLDVEVDDGDGGPKRVIQVYVETQQKGQMPWLGGYRNKRTGAHYLHASVQTDRKPKLYAKDAKFTRDTQVPPRCLLRLPSG
jgi:hypothetical protein